MFVFDVGKIVTLMSQSSLGSIKKLSEHAGLNQQTVGRALHGKPVTAKVAGKILTALQADSSKFDEFVKVVCGWRNG